jgi:hypothetical protein
MKTTTMAKDGERERMNTTEDGDFLESLRQWQGQMTTTRTDGNAHYHYFTERLPHTHTLFALGPRGYDLKLPPRYP